MNGKLGDSPLSDLTIHGKHPFPPAIEELLLRIDKLGRGPNRYPLGENWPFGMKDSDWTEGRNLDEARELLNNFIRMLEEGRGDEIMLDPTPRQPLDDSSDV